MLARLLGPCLLVFLGVTGAACSGERSSPGESSAAPKVPATPVHPIGCATAAVCADALIAAGAPFTNHGRGMKYAATDADEARCNTAMFTVRRAVDTAPARMALPSACAVDGEALWTAVGAPHDLCTALAACGEALNKLGDPTLDGSGMLLEVAERARSRGYAGERLCNTTLAAAQDQWMEAGRSNLPAPCL